MVLIWGIMNLLTITNTGIFNTIWPSLFPPIAGKETITFLIGLLYQTDEPLPFDIDRGLSDKEKRSRAEQAIALERKRIREYVRAVCEEMEKSYENARTAFLYTLPEFIRFGT